MLPACSGGSSSDNANETKQTVSEVETNAGDDSDYNKKLDETVSSAKTDIESIINGLNDEWESLKGKIDFLESYKSNLNGINSFYDKIRSETEAYGKIYYKCLIDYCKTLQSSGLSCGEKYDYLSDMNEIFQIDIPHLYKDNVYNALMDNMEDHIDQALSHTEEGLKESINFTDDRHDYILKF